MMVTDKGYLPLSVGADVRRIVADGFASRQSMQASARAHPGRHEDDADAAHVRGAWRDPGPRVAALDYLVALARTSRCRTSTWADWWAARRWRQAGSSACSITAGISTARSPRSARSGADIAGLTGGLLSRDVPWR